ncbi:MAG: gluconate 2-dehydrogenase subunit 3 family protein [Terriglobia bacterium]
MKSDNEKKSDGEPTPDPKTEEATSVSRREWLLSVGGAALIAGLPASPGSAAIPAVPVGAAHPEAALPPGLYSPSSECLGRALESDGLFHPVPPGSETDYVRPLVGPFRPAFFSADEFQALRRLVELLLGLDEGEADAVCRWIDLRVASAAGIRRAAKALSPEHRAVAVAYYGAEYVNHQETNAPEPVCREGLAWLKRESQQRHGAKFIALSEQQQTEILKLVSGEQPEKENENAGTRFFKLLKAEAVAGYYTSRGGLKELDYQGNQFHAQSPACNLPLKNISPT